MSDFYYLNSDHTYKKCDMNEDYINGYLISTVWLGLDHGYGLNDKPLLFETMVFNDNRDSLYMTRYTTWDEAEEGHKKAIKWVKDGCIKD